MNTFGKVVIVIVVLAILGYGGYRIWHHYTWKNQAAVQQAQQQTMMKPKPSEMAKPSAMMEKNSVFQMVSDKKLGTIMKDPKGMTLYTFAKDTAGVSNCSGACMTLWPPYSAKSATGTFPTNISVIKRSDGTFQYAWKGMPLYYYSKDKDSGDAYGNGVAALWSVVK